ncbi:glycosyltransferase [Euzebya rosea]|uniref:glycosyltransferase n=1 Tax=Euzebya rosea TaxID=2052804 RepID=UPI0014728C54|nr:glycosyltransferase [Euzebya rosea]
MARTSPPPAPLLSAALIVRDEEAVIERCLASLQEVVDEVVVLDTGSTDRTVALARATGARVVEGTWHDDFGRSRNEVLDHCVGRWAVIVDADEVLFVHDVAGLRRTLRRSRADALQVTVDSYRDDVGTVGMSHQSLRVLRRRRVRYEGRLHEEVRPVRPDASLQVERTSLITIGHWGYIQRIVEERGKTERNIRICEAAIAEGAGLRGVVDLGRTLAAAGRLEEALVRFEEARAADDGFTRRTALAHGAATLVRLERATEALTWVDQLGAASRFEGAVDVLRAEVLVALGRTDAFVAAYERALAAAEGNGGVVPHDDGVGPAAERVRADLGSALLAAGRTEEGVAHLLEAAGEGAMRIWPQLVAGYHQLGQLERVAALLDPEGDVDRCRLVLAELAADPGPGVSALLEVLDDAYPGSALTVAFAPLVADHLHLEQAVKWSARARAAGLSAHCPLASRATSETLGATDRLLSAAVLVELFDDDRGRHGVEAVAAVLDPPLFGDLLGLVGQLAPAALELLVLSAVTTPARGVAMARALGAHGERDAAREVLAHGLSLGHVDPAVRQDADDLLAELSARPEQA